MTHEVMKYFRSTASMALGLAMLFGSAAAAERKLQVAALHPLMADLATQVGGDMAEVYDLVGRGNPVHSFEPQPKDIVRMQRADVILAAGNNLETYLPRLRDNLKKAVIVEVGKTIPDIKAQACDACGEHEHNHKHGELAVDPHWWNSVVNMSRAADVVAEALGRSDPAHKEAYLRNAAAYRRQLSELKDWAELRLAAIPATRRKLATAHNAFAYFAKEFDFTVIAVAGLNDEQSQQPQDLAATLKKLQDADVVAVFPDANGSNKSLGNFVKDAKLTLAKPLFVDGCGSKDVSGFIPITRYNVTVIAEALEAKK